MKNILTSLLLLFSITCFAQQADISTQNKTDSLKVLVGQSGTSKWVWNVDLQKNQQAADYLIEKIGSIVYARSRKGSALSNFSGTDAYTVIQAAITALTPSGVIGSGGGHIHIAKGNYALSNELTIIGWEWSGGVQTYGASQIVITGDGLSTKLSQSTASKNAIVVKNNASFVFRDFYVFVGSTSKCGILLDNTGSNTVQSSFRSVIDNVQVESTSTTNAAAHFKNFFDLSIPFITANNTSFDGIIVENNSTTVNYGNSNWGFVRATTSTATGRAGLRFVNSGTNSFMNLITINNYQCYSSYYGIYSEGLKFSRINFVDIEEAAFPVFFTGTAAGYYMETNNVTLGGGYLLMSSGGIGIKNSLYTSSNTFKDIQISGNSSVIPISDDQQFRSPNEYDVTLGLIAMAANIAITSSTVTPLTYKMGGSGYISKRLPDGTLAGTPSVAGAVTPKSYVDAAVSNISVAGASQFKAYTDFVTTLQDGFFSNTTSGTGTTISNVATSTVNEIGVAQGALGTTATGRAGVYSNNVNVLRLGGGVATFEAKVNIVNLSDATNTFIFRAGFTQNVAIEGSNFVGFRYTHSAQSGAWEAYSRSSDTESAFSTGIPVVAGTWYNLKAVVNAAASLVTFYINGNPVGNVSTNIPTGSGKEMGYMVSASRSAGTSPFTAWQCDFMNITYAFTTSR